VVSCGTNLAQLIFVIAIECYFWLHNHKGRGSGSLTGLKFPTTLKTSLDSTTITGEIIQWQNYTYLVIKPAYMLLFLAWDYECVVVLTSITQLSAFCKDIHDYKHIDKNQTEMVWNWEIWYISNHERSVHTNQPSINDFSLSWVVHGKVFVWNVNKNIMQAYMNN